MRFIFCFALLTLLAGCTYDGAYGGGNLREPDTYKFSSSMSPQEVANRSGSLTEVTVRSNKGVAVYWVHQYDSDCPRVVYYDNADWATIEQVATSRRINPWNGAPATSIEVFANSTSTWMIVDSACGKQIYGHLRGNLSRTVPSNEKIRLYTPTGIQH